VTIPQSKLDRIQSNSKTLKGEADLIEKQVTNGTCLLSLSLPLLSL
jgi:hypothetical protein